MSVVDKVPLNKFLMGSYILTSVKSTSNISEIMPYIP